MPMTIWCWPTTKSSDDVVYKLAKMMHDHKEELAANFGGLNGFDPDRMAKDLGPAQYHPGAIKYYKEIGALAAEGRPSKPIRIKRFDL